MILEYVRTGQNCVDIMARAASKEIFDAVALSARLLVNDEGQVRPAHGIHLDRIGEMVITPAIMNDEGEVTEPAAIDKRYHVNIRITEPALSDSTDGEIEDWKLIVMQWASIGKDGHANAEEQSKEVNGVELIKQATVKSPSRVWF
jgi:hypothetical protein